MTFAVRPSSGESRRTRWDDHLMLHDCAMAILRNADTVLMCHRHPDREWVPDVWDFPGGHVEAHETPQQALARELEEELGVAIAAPSRPADEVLYFEDESVRLSIWCIDYVGPIENRCPEEHDDVRWVSLAEATQLDLADAEYIPLLQRVLRGLPPRGQRAVMEPRTAPEPDPADPPSPVGDDAGDDEIDDSESDGGLIDRLRGTGVGVEDPNIVGDVGPLDVPPGADPTPTISPDLPVVEGDEPGEV